MSCNVITWQGKSLTDEQLQADLQNLPENAKYSEIYLNDNRLTRTPDLTAEKFSQLRSLNLGGNVLTEIDLQKIPKSLESLLLDNNILSSMPDFSGRNLLDIFLAKNKIIVLKKGYLPSNLNCIDLSDNNLGIVEDFPGDTEGVSLFNNPVSQILPDCFKNEATYNVIKAGISGDQILSLREPPPEIFTLGYSDVKEYFDSKGTFTEPNPGCSSLVAIAPSTVEQTELNYESSFRSDMKSVERFLEEEDMSETVMCKIFFTGPHGHGKTSLKESLKFQKNCTSKSHSKGQNISYNIWKMDEKVATLMVELGGPGNNHLINCFHNNSENNFSLVVHEITNFNYLETCETITDILCRSPKNTILVVLTKCDLLDCDPDKLQEKKQQFLSFIEKHLNKEIEILQRKKWSHNNSKLNVVIEQYQLLKRNLEDRTYTVSCQTGYGLSNLRSSLLQIFAKNTQKPNIDYVYNFFVRLCKFSGNSSIKSSNELLVEPKYKRRKESGEYNVIRGSQSFNMQKLPFISYRDAFSEFDHCCNIGNYDISDGNMEDVLKNLLKFLHDQGLIIWIDTSKLKEIIFLDVPAFFNIFKFIFPENPPEFFSFKNLTSEMKGSLFLQDIGETDYNQMLEDLCQRGLVSKILLGTLAHQFGMENDTAILSEILLYYSIVYEVPDPDLLLFVPWFNQNEEVPEQLRSVLQQLEKSDKDHLALHFVFKGSIPSALFHTFCVRVYKYLIPNRDTQHRTFWKHNLYATVNNNSFQFQKRKFQCSIFYMVMKLQFPCKYIAKS